MSIKTKVLAAAATLTLISGVGAAGALSAGAATPSCGPDCLDLFSKDFGTFHNPGFVMDVFRQGARVGQPLILFKTSNSDPAQDFTVSFQGQVSDFRAAGLVGPQVNLHYGCNFNVNTNTCGNLFPDDFAFEVEYSPYGVGSGLCVGVSRTAYQNEGVSLQGCGVSPNTVWIVDTLDSCPFNPLTRNELPVINGSDNNFSHPFVLTYPNNGYPTDSPRPQLTTQELTGFTGSFLVPVLGTVNDNQLWGADFGVLK